MKARFGCSIFVVLLAVFWFGSVCSGLSTREIDRVRDKGVLNNKDLQIVDSFVGAAVQELMRIRDFSSVARLHTTLMSRYSSAQESAQQQYVEQFTESAYKHISRALEQSKSLEPKDRRFKVVVNLLIMIDNMEDVRLAGLAVNFLEDQNEVVRYWAVRSVTGSAVTKKLNVPSTANLRQAKAIVSGLEPMVGRSSPEITGVMARFAANINISHGQALLLKITDERIGAYANWTVEGELLDATILKLLCDKMVDAKGQERAELGRRFAQLYSYVIQRYVKGRDRLSEQQKQQLVSVMVEVEKSCISKLMETPQATIKSALERGDYQKVMNEHDRLLGNEERAGELLLRLKFDYGQSDGGKVVGPRVLGERGKVGG